MRTSNHLRVGRACNLTLATAILAAAVFDSLPALYGLRTLALPIAGTPCTLLVDPLVASPFQTSSRGYHHESVVMPARLRGTVTLQALLLLPIGELQGSNGIRLDFH